MAMTILNNTSSMMTLGELNKNISKVGKDLKKLSTGERLPGFGEGASDVAISEKMRAQIRGLSQDERNVQNGMSLLKVAEGGMQEIVNNLRSIRELAINAANDHNTDDDRRVLQKDIEQRKENINEIASTTSFNDRLLLMGDYSVSLRARKTVYEPYYETVKEDVAVQVGTTEKQITVTTPSVKYIPGTTGKPGVLIQNNYVEGFTKSLTPAYISCSYYKNPVALYPRPDGTPCDIGFYGYSSDRDFLNPYPTNGQEIIRSYVKDLLTYDASATDRADHAVFTATRGKFATFDDLQTSFNRDLRSAGNLIKFLKDYCDIDLTNTDNGAITGSDVNPDNPTISAEDIINERMYSDTSKWTMPTPGTTSRTPGGITVTWPTTDNVGNALTSDAEFVMKGLNTVWLDRAWNQIVATYPGMFSSYNPARNLTIEFHDFNANYSHGIESIKDNSGNITGFKLTLGKSWFQNIDQTNPNGYTSTNLYADRSKYLDNYVAMLMTDMSLKGVTDFSNVYDSPLSYGIPYSVTGHDDSISPTSSSWNSQYDIGYALMRYMGKQSVEYTGGGTAYATSKHMAVNAKFDQLTKAGAAASVSDLNQQGFTIACGGCNQYINIKFDTSTAQTSYERESNNAQLVTYTIGLANLTDISKLGQAIFDGIKSIDIDKRRYNNDLKDVYDSNGDAVSVVIDGAHDLRMMQDPNNPGSFLFTKTNSPMMGFIEGTVIEEPIAGSGEEFPGGATVVYETTTKTITVPVFEYHEEDVEIYAGEVPKTVYEDVSNPLYIHTGTKANQNIAIHINDMRTKAMGLTDDVGVHTRQKASDSLEKIDDAIQYALDEITRVGSIQNRLEYTVLNLVAANENTSAAESTIRDADMAKEMTSFTKNNVLMQASQAMMSQANQNASGVLGLLQ